MHEGAKKVLSLVVMCLPKFIQSLIQYLRRFATPMPLPYSLTEAQAWPFQKRVQHACQAWALQGYGTPALLLVYYVLKNVIALTAWFFFAGFSTQLSDTSAWSAWYLNTEALGKGILVAMLYESLGLGCGSGPLTGRFLPFITAPLHFFRPGTIRLPTFSQAPLARGDKRTWFDVLLYTAYLLSLLWALIAKELSLVLLLPILIILLMLGWRDKTVFLNARPEHYWLALACLCFPSSSLGGLQWLWLGIWFWAATSKLNAHFPSVIAVMISNSAVVRSAWLRKQLYRNYPDDLRPSKLTQWLAHLGTATEYAFPLLLVIGGEWTLPGLLIMTSFHLFITAHMPMGTPILWNVIMVGGAWVLFGSHQELAIFSISDPLLIGLLLLGLVVLPVVGNLFPRYVSFLLSMRYYAGNWAYSFWLFKKDSAEKLDANLTKCSPLIEKQLGKIYPQEVVVSIFWRMFAFRSMHLHGRLLQELLPRAIDRVDDYTWLDGEVVAGIALGWNFGDGHLHDEQLLRAIQNRCHFAAGELRVIMVESQPLQRASHAWRIWDAQSGLMERGEMPLKLVQDKQPWTNYD